MRTNNPFEQLECADCLDMPDDQLCANCAAQRTIIHTQTLPTVGAQIAVLDHASHGISGLGKQYDIAYRVALALEIEQLKIRQID